MAVRIEDVVVRGEIDNTVEGKTSGWLWVLGRTKPVALELEGDCWRDLAGSRLKFSNPNPGLADGVRLADVQSGVVGDMTASRKYQVPTCGPEEFAVRNAAGERVPSVWKNCLYLEWFSEENGRVVLESTDYTLELSDHEWEMDRDGEEAQKLANLQAMRDFLCRMIRRRPARPESHLSEDDEFEWEERLKESDRLTDAYHEVLEKYMDDPDSERKEAFVMGWDGLLEAMADEAEGEDGEVPEWKREAFEAAMESEDWHELDEDDDELFRQHPLQEEAQEMALRAFDLVKDDAKEGECDAGIVSGELMKVAGKLAGALNGTYEREVGYVLAILKRCLVFLNDALAACGRLAEAETDPDQARALEALRDEIFGLRSKLTDLRRKLKGD